MPKFPKGSDEAKEWGKKMAKAKADKKTKTMEEGDKVVASVFGASQLNLPKFFVLPSKKGWKLVSPTSQERNLSKRGNMKSLEILKKPIEKGVYVDKMSEPIPLLMFSKKDREKIKANFEKIDEVKGKPLDEIPAIIEPKPAERGRPEKMPKNIEINKERAKGAKAKGRPSKYATDEERKQAKKEQTKASDAKRYAKKKAEKEQVDATGEGLFSKKGDRYTAKVDKILKDNGSKVIKSITVKRTPLNWLMTGTLNAVSFGLLNKRMEENDIDELFHLFMELVMEDGMRIGLEKNERIDMNVNMKTRPKTETETIDGVASGITLDELMQKTRDKMGDDKFFNYSAKNNNCSDFILAVMDANDIGNAGDKTFVIQDAKTLFGKSTFLRKLVNTATDIAGKITDVVGNGMKEETMETDVPIAEVQEIAGTGKPKKTSSWLELVKKVKADNKGMSLKEVLKLASKMRKA
tara:strand:- start:2566 stop:3960 length:1395 start_codon:yes stop_codon:yes gene_type:complete